MRLYTNLHDVKKKGYVDNWILNIARDTRVLIKDRALKYFHKTLLIFWLQEICCLHILRNFIFLNPGNLCREKRNYIYIYRFSHKYNSWDIFSENNRYEKKFRKYYFIISHKSSSNKKIVLKIPTFYRWKRDFTDILKQTAFFLH